MKSLIVLKEEIKIYKEHYNTYGIHLEEPYCDWFGKLSLPIKEDSVIKASVDFVKCGFINHDFKVIYTDIWTCTENLTYVVLTNLLEDLPESYD